jgi:hypothetical protein
MTGTPNASSPARSSAVVMMATGLTALGASRLADQSVSLRQPATAAGAIDLALRATAADPSVRPGC